MKAVILVGGEGTRLRPLTANLPKPMIPVVNRPFLEHVFDYLKENGVRDVILSMGYRSDVIERHFGDGRDFGIALTYVVEDHPLGTAGGVKNVEAQLGDSRAEPFFVFNGDIMTDLDLRAMAEFHRASQARVTIALTPVEDPTAYGLVETDDRRRVQRFLEKPRPEEVTTNLINAGTYVVERDVMDHVPTNTYYMFERGLFPFLLESGRPIFGYPSECYWIDIGTPAKYRAVHHDILGGRVGRKPVGHETEGRVWVGPGASVDSTATVSGPVVLGANVRIGPHASVMGPTVLGDGCQVGEGATIEDAIVWSGARVGAKASLRTCIVGARGTIGESVSLGGGAIVGDDCAIGEHNHLDNAIRIWPRSVIAPRSITF